MLLPWPETNVTFLRLLGVHSLNKMHFNTGYQKLLGESEMEQYRKGCVYMDKALKYRMKPPSPCKVTASTVHTLCARHCSHHREC